MHGLACLCVALEFVLQVISSGTQSRAATPDLYGSRPGSRRHSRKSAGCVAICLSGQCISESKKHRTVVVHLVEAAKVVNVMCLVYGMIGKLKKRTFAQTHRCPISTGPFTSEGTRNGAVSNLQSGGTVFVC